MVSKTKFPFFLKEEASPKLSWMTNQGLEAPLNINDASDSDKPGDKQKLYVKGK